MLVCEKNQNNLNRNVLKAQWTVCKFSQKESGLFMLHAFKERIGLCASKLANLRHASIELFD